MMGMSISCNPLVGATTEPWFHLKGEPLIHEMKKKREEIPNIVMEALGG